MFTAAAGAGAIPLVVIGVVASAIAVYFYVRVIMLMFFTRTAGRRPDVLPPGSMTLVVIALCLSGHLRAGNVPATRAGSG